MSNAPPIRDALSTVPDSPLNAIAGTDMDSGIALHIDKAKNPRANFSSLQDIWVGIDYIADV